jgi:vacuolar protein sorting-associated protein IST1
MNLLFPYSESKLKPFLKMATQRINIANNKRGTASKKHKREIAKLMEDGKAEKAIIRVEHVIRDDYTMEAYEIIEIMCDLLYERARHLTKSELCPPDLVEAVSTVLWASTRVDISELDGAKKQLQKKYGKEFVELCEENSRNTVNSRVMHKLNVVPPSNLLIRSYLQEIAKEYCVEW